MTDTTLDPFSLALTRALEAGTERPPQPLEPQPDTFERPVMLALSNLPPDGPAVPRAEVVRKVSRGRRARDEYLDRLFDAANAKPPVDRFAVTDLADGYCRFPVTDDSPFRFCGDKTARTYCEHHARIAYRQRAEAITEDVT